MEKEDQLFTVYEAAKQLNVTPQYIYQELKKPNSKYNKYVVMVDNRRFLRKEVVQEAKSNDTDNNDMVVNTDVIQTLREQLRVKDEQIAKQQETIQTLLGMIQANMPQSNKTSQLEEKQEQEPKRRLLWQRLFRKD